MALVVAQRSRRARRAASPPVQREDRIVAWCLILPALLLLGLLILLPLGIALEDSFLKIGILDQTGPFVGLHNYGTLLSDSTFQSTMLRNVLWTAENLILQVAGGIAIALVLNMAFRGRGLVRALAIAPYATPAIVVAILFRFAVNDTYGVTAKLQSIGILHGPPGLLEHTNTALITSAFINSWRYTPFVALVLLARLQTLPSSLREAAAIDGAGHWATFRHIVLPWLWPAIIVAALLRTIWSFSDFDLLYLIAFGGPLSATTTMSIYIRNLAFDDGNAGLAGAAAALLAICLVAIYLGYRHLEKNAKT